MINFVDEKKLGSFREKPKILIDKMQRKERRVRRKSKKRLIWNFNEHFNKGILGCDTSQQRSKKKNQTNDNKK